MKQEQLLQRLTEHSLSLDAKDQFPAQQFEWLANTDVLKWVIPAEFGGKPASELEMIQSYEELAEACLITTFVLTQRNGACQRIAGCANEEVKRLLLPDLAMGKTFATVGISHLTTSRQHIKKPAVQAVERQGQYVLNGFIPWVTGVTAAQHIVTGGTCENGEQVLIAMPTNVPGVTIQEPSELMALTASHTASVTLDEVRVPKEYLLAGPVENVMQSGKGGGAGSLTTSVLALGLCTRMLTLLQAQAEKRPELISTVEQFETDVNRLRDDVHPSVLGETSATATSIRHRINSLALRITQAALAITKGAGFVKGHPVELAVREAMFFLVWSCPQPVVDEVLSELACRDGWGE